MLLYHTVDSKYLMSSLSNHIKLYSCPNNISYSNSGGFLLYQYVSLQIVTGILLALHYT
jgi:quinol-cytochrome oxidoreductase complex cytochrome b subunit